MIWAIHNELQGSNETKSAYYDYAHFFKAFVDVYNELAAGYSYKDSDKFLWIYGKRNGVYIE